MTRRPLRVPSVEDYDRMTQAARASAAALVAERIELIEARRKALAETARFVSLPELPYTPPPNRAMRADEYTAEDTRRAASLLIRLAARKWPEPQHVKAQRQADMVADLDGWSDPRSRKDVAA